MTDWQPIETAPKDGTPILACVHDEFSRPDFEVVRWEPLSYNWPSSWAAGPNCGEHSFRHGVTPTYWMPLPEPPK